MAYTLRFDASYMAEQRLRISSRLATETDEEKVKKLVLGLAQFDAYVESYSDVHGSDETTGYAQQSNYKATSILGGI